MKKKFVDKKRELNFLRKKMLEIMSLFDKGQQKGSVWLLGSREFNSFDQLILFVKQVLKSVVDEYRPKLVTFNFIMNEECGRMSLMLVCWRSWNMRRWVCLQTSLSD